MMDPWGTFSWPQVIIFTAAITIIIDRIFVGDCKNTECGFDPYYSCIRCCTDKVLLATAQAAAAYIVAIASSGLSGWFAGLTAAAVTVAYISATADIIDAGDRCHAECILLECPSTETASCPPQESNFI